MDWKPFPGTCSFFKTPLLCLFSMSRVWGHCLCRLSHYKRNVIRPFFLTLWMKIWELNIRHIFEVNDIYCFTDCILSQSNKTPNENYSGKINRWCFAFYLQLENKITVIIPVMSHSTQANILNTLNSFMEMFTWTQ